MTPEAINTEIPVWLTIGSTMIFTLIGALGLKSLLFNKFMAAKELKLEEFRANTKKEVKAFDEMVKKAFGDCELIGKLQKQIGGYEVTVEELVKDQLELKAQIDKLELRILELERLNNRFKEEAKKYRERCEMLEGLLKKHKIKIDHELL